MAGTSSGVFVNARSKLSWKRRACHAIHKGMGFHALPDDQGASLLTFSLPMY
jgi:hypothetical protein